MFHRPPRTRARHGPRSGSRSPGSGRTSAARFFVSGGSVPPTRHPVPTTRHRCRHARSTDSPAIRGWTRSSRRPWRGRRAPVGGVRTCARSASAAAIWVCGPASDAAAFACNGTRASGTEGRPAWEFREGRRRERLTVSATRERLDHPTRAQAGWGDFRSGAHHEAKEVADDDAAAMQLKGGRRARSPKHVDTRLPVPRPSVPPRHPHHRTARTQGAVAQLAERYSLSTPCPGLPGRRRRVIDLGSRGRGFESRRLHCTKHRSEPGPTQEGATWTRKLPAERRLRAPRRRKGKTSTARRPRTRRTP